jgi:DNA-binding XRE family transcriptional regulator
MITSMTSPRKTALGKRLQALRDRLDLTQEDAAGRIRVARRTWHMWETGQAKPQPSYLLLIEMLEKGQL